MRQTAAATAWGLQMTAMLFGVHAGVMKCFVGTDVGSNLIPI